MTDDPAGPVIDPPGSSRAEQPPPYQWIVRGERTGLRTCPPTFRLGHARPRGRAIGVPAPSLGHVSFEGRMLRCCVEREPSPVGAQECRR